jgi:hypothetical protein
MLHPGPYDWKRPALDSPYCGVGNDSASAGNRSVHCGQVFRKMRKKQLIGDEVATVLVLLAGAYLWGPGSAPRGQEPVVTLSEGSPREFEKAFDAETGCSTPSLAAVSHLTDLSAGGLRSSATVGTARRPKGACACCRGADPCSGLAATEWQHTRTNRRRSRTPVLGPEARRVRRTEGSRNPDSASAEAELLHSKWVLLGRSDSVSSPRALDEASVGSNSREPQMLSAIAGLCVALYCITCITGATRHGSPPLIYSFE